MGIEQHAPSVYSHDHHSQRGLLLAEKEQFGQTVSRMPSSRSAAIEGSLGLTDIRTVHRAPPPPGSLAHSQKEKRFELWTNSHCNERAAISSANPIDCRSDFSFRGIQKFSSERPGMDASTRIGIPAPR